MIKPNFHDTYKLSSCFLENQILWEGANKLVGSWSVPKNLYMRAKSSVLYKSFETCEVCSKS